MKTYLYRCTEQQLEEHLQRIAEAGDAVEHVVYKGGRDYVLVCRQDGAVDTVADLSPDELEELLVRVNRRNSDRVLASAATDLGARVARSASKGARGDQR